MPELIAYRNSTAKEIALHMKYQKHWKNVEEFKKEHLERLKPAVCNQPNLIFQITNLTSCQLEVHRKELLKKHHCTTAATMAIPIISQIPLFVTSTMFFSHIAHRPTPLDDESFWALTSMARPDPTATIPIALGLVTLANVETSHWFVGEEKRERTRVAQEAKERREKELESQGNLRLQPRSIIQGGLRVFSVARIIIGTMVDGVSCRLHRLIGLLLTISACTVGPHLLVILSEFRSRPDLGIQLVVREEIRKTKSTEITLVTPICRVYNCRILCITPTITPLSHQHNRGPQPRTLRRNNT